MTDKQKRQAHFKTIHVHRKHVRHWCFKMGLVWQGLTHDLSKYSRAEFDIYKFYGGTKSPHEVARDQLGYSPFWIYHKNHNKHHWEFWLDNQDSEMIPIKIPYKYVVEMFCDFVGAGKAYSKGKWNVHMPLDYYEAKCRGKRLINKYSEELLTKLMQMLIECGNEKEFFKWYKRDKKWLVAIYGD